MASSWLRLLMKLIVNLLILRKCFECTHSQRIGIAHCWESFNHAATQGAVKGVCRLKEGLDFVVVHFFSFELVSDVEKVEIELSFWEDTVQVVVVDGRGTVSEIGGDNESFGLMMGVCKQFKMKACSTKWTKQGFTSCFENPLGHPCSTLLFQVPMKVHLVLHPPIVPTWHKYWSCISHGGNHDENDLFHYNWSVMLWSSLQAR